MKQISSRFSIAVHTMSMIALKPSECTGDYIARSVNSNPVIIRKIIAQLKKAGFIQVKAGVGGASLLKSADEITLLDIYRAVEAADGGDLFKFHKSPAMDCSVGKHIEEVLHPEMVQAQLALEQSLSSVSLAQIVTELEQRALESS
ncbi:Rrf2 family transcriptional regulator [Paenibacillus sp. NPDC057934]|uniref:Rrf2 family transcriptional regulator n=1 Tax=Paenibacillus sp. NPDC057934 TaxID=3346282 RepID=UPI0036D861C5